MKLTELIPTFSADKSVQLSETMFYSLKLWVNLCNCEKSWTILSNSVQVYAVLFLKTEGLLMYDTV